MDSFQTFFLTYWTFTKSAFSNFFILEKKKSRSSSCSCKMVCSSIFWFSTTWSLNPSGNSWILLLCLENPISVASRQGRDDTHSITSSIRENIYTLHCSTEGSNTSFTFSEPSYCLVLWTVKVILSAGLFCMFSIRQSKLISWICLKFAIFSFCSNSFTILFKSQNF